MNYLEQNGYDAGYAGKPLEESKGWSDAWNVPGGNLPAPIIAG